MERDDNQSGVESNRSLRTGTDNHARRFLTTVRVVVQWGFLVWVIGIGIRFGLFINSVESGAVVPLVSRPAGVEGFLPIGALTSLKYWMVTGIIHPVHPAALVIFLSILLMSLVAKKSFCSWLCPVGTLSEVAHKLGRQLFGRNFRIWLPLDILLRCIKYLLLFLFMFFILLGMSGDALVAFLDAPYWAISDVKMLHFFTHMSRTTLVVLAILTGLSLFYKMFWCRYLCPYGALLGLASMLSPFKVRRDADGCSGCRSCTAVCPSGIEVHACTAVSSPECTGCLTCVAHCPERDVLAMQPLFWKKPLPTWVFPTLVVLIYLAGITAGMLGGHWQSSLSYADYQRLMPLVQSLGH